MDDQTVKTIGKILKAELPRDAIHVAVVSVVAKENLFPGQRISAAGKADEKGPGIVDPFLLHDVMEGERFWMFLKPGSITSLRHDWTHPEFPNDGSIIVTEKQKKDSLKWLKDFTSGWSYHGDFDVEYLLTELCHPEGGVFAGTNTSATDEVRSHPEFWTHVENVTGKRFDSNVRENTYFSCSC